MNCLKKEETPKYRCDICNFNFKNTKTLNKHQNSKKHKSNLNKQDNIQDDSTYKYACVECSFVTNYKYNYNKHIKSKKHQQMLNPEIFKCDCGKVYKYKTTLERHQTKCKPSLINNLGVGELFGALKSVLEQNTELANQNVKITDNITILANQNTSLTNQNTNLANQNTELTKQMHDQFNSVVELAKEPKTVNTYNDNKVSITTYLNTQCKDAKNLDDFLRTAKYSFEEIEEMYEIGWLNSTINKLKELFDDLDQTLRPIHCTDAKRKQFYIKMKDEWEKIIGTRLLEIVVFIIQKTQTATLMDWKKKNSEKLDKDDYLHNK
jgi:predicted transcriptional regulator